MFIEIPANSGSIIKRKLINGFGVNDAKYMTSKTINNKKIYCPFYSRWKGIINRCYSSSKNKKLASYKDCFVCDEWLLFSNFRLWMEAQDWAGKCIDKDILIQGNKEYCPEKCIFVTEQVNKMLLDSKSRRGGLKVGVSICRGKFLAGCRNNGKRVYLGYYESEHEAHEEYKKCKYEIIRLLAIKQKEPLRSALLAWVIVE
tara:strand:- start:27 stop:629 length:603 start_codon:yes stop_codon:yes gene_type:complete